MTYWTLLRQSARFYARAHLGVILGAAIGGTTLIGALLVGDSVRASLLRKSLEAVGPFEFALMSGDRLFNADLAERLWSALSLGQSAVNLATTQESESVASSRQARGAAALLILPAVVTSNEGADRANQVQAIGCGPEFFRLTSASSVTLGPGDALANPALAMQLNLRPGSEVLVRVPKPGALSREVTLAERDQTTTTLRLKIAGTLEALEGGDFSLVRNQASPLNLFIGREALAAAVQQKGKANAIAVTRFSGRAADPAPEAALAAAMTQSWRAVDASLEVRVLPGREVELRTPRVFLEPAVLASARAAVPTIPFQPVLTYLANLIELGTNRTPYSFVTAAGPPLTPEEMKDDELLLNQWLAEDLQAKPGDRVSLVYFLPESGASLKEATNDFIVRGIVPMQTPWADRTLMPDFPGIEKAESTGDWEVGFELVHKIRPKDEEYWKARRGTPKAFVTVAAGQKMWSNRFGDLTAARWPAGETVQAAGVESNLLAHLDPERVGLRFEPIRQQAIQSARQAQDFGQLFLGFSMFLLFAALLLVSLLFQFGLEQRAGEVGALLAMGFTQRQMKRVVLGEGLLLASAGGLLGVLGGIVYARAMLWGLKTLWRDAVGTSGLLFHAEPATLAIGFAASVLVALLALWLTARRLCRQPALELLAASGGDGGLEWSAGSARSYSRWAAAAAALAGLGILGWSLAGHDNANAGAFFGAGALLLLAGLAFVSAWLGQLGHRGSAGRFTLSALGIRGSARRRKRSLATVALLGCGAFLIVSVSAFRLETGRDSGRKLAGTGGFSLIGEAAMGVVQDLNSKAGLQSLGLNPADLEGVRIVSMRAKSGDDASCLNLNRAQKPRLLGVRPNDLAGRFTFTRMADKVHRDAGWNALRRSSNTPTDEVPAIGDASSIQWALGKKVGETIDYMDESGRSFKLRLVGAVGNSVLQGSLLIDEEEFVRRFPSESGYRAFLIDTTEAASLPRRGELREPPFPTGETSSATPRLEVKTKASQSSALRNKRTSELREYLSDAIATQLQASLTRALQDFGLQLTPTSRRLEAFNAVQNTYLGAFQVLGGLGLLLGSAGLGIVVLRNILERRGELGLLTAVGFSPGALRWMLLLEHGALLGLGIGIGSAAGLAAVLPALLTPGTPLAYQALALTLAGVLLNGMLWTWAATRLALKGSLVAALRNE